MGKLKRIYCAYTKKNIQNNRKGECKQCGTCCKLPVRCLFYFRDRCIIYKHRFRPCKVFPARPSDVEEINCGFRFDENALKAAQNLQK